jgi:hypothetical protein
MATEEAVIFRTNGSRNRECSNAIVCTSLDQLEPVLITGGENDVENGQNLQKAAKKRRIECGASRPAGVESAHSQSLARPHGSAAGLGTG